MFDRFSIAVAVHKLRHGGIIAYPTEAVFGLGCDPHNTTALENLIRLKCRSRSAGFILIASSIEQASDYFRVDNEILEKISNSWPGPTTWVLPAGNIHPLVTGGRDTVAMRVSAHPVCAALCHEMGSPIVSTSANLNRQQPALNALQLRRKLGNKLDGIVNGPVGGALQPTRIIDATTDRFLRS